jgi:hypothetical protein
MTPAPDSAGVIFRESRNTASSARSIPSSSPAQPEHDRQGRAGPQGRTDNNGR